MLKQFPQCAVKQLRCHQGMHASLPEPVSEDALHMQAPIGHHARASSPLGGWPVFQRICTFSAQPGFSEGCHPLASMGLSQSPRFRHSLPVFSFSFIRNYSQTTRPPSKIYLISLSLSYIQATNRMATINLAWVAWALLISGCTAADFGDDFANNLLTDLAP